MKIRRVNAVLECSITTLPIAPNDSTVVIIAVFVLPESFILTQLRVVTGEGVAAGLSTGAPLVITDTLPTILQTGVTKRSAGDQI